MRAPAVQPKATLASYEAQKLRYDRAYAAGRPLISDSKYDKFIRNMRRLFPASGAARAVGTDDGPRNAKRVKLPIVVGSLDICRPGEVAKWMKEKEKESKVKQTGWLVEPKFDGVSLTVAYTKGVRTAAWTRGKVVDGESLGYEVCAAASMVQGVLGRLRATKLIDINREYLVRGETIMHRSLFREHYANKPEAGGYVSERNLVAGVFNRGKPEEVKSILGHCTFIALQLYVRGKDGKWTRPHSTHKEWVLLTLLGFTTALNPVRYSAGHAKIYKLVAAGHEGLRAALPVHEIGGSVGALSYWDHAPSEDEVIARLRDIHKVVDIPCDGIVVQPLDVGHWVKRGEHLAQYPSHIRAIKLEAADQEAYQGAVGKIEWNVKKSGMLKPRLILRETIDMKGVSVDHATCNNAAFVEKWGLRTGRHLKLVRSGDVIPRIVAAYEGKSWVPLQVRLNGDLVDGPGIKDSHVVGTLPTACPACGSKVRWTKTHTDLVCTSERCSGRHGSNVLSFFKTLKVDDVAEGTVSHLLTLDGVKGVADIFKIADPRRLARLEGYGERKAQIVANAILGSMKGVPLAKVMHASGIFTADAHALGSTRLQDVIDKIGEGMVARGTSIELRAKLAKLPGIGKSSIDLFIDSLPAWRTFYTKIERWHTPPSVKRTGIVACWTGYRDNAQEQFLTARGGRVASSMSKKVTVLFAAGPSEKTKKADRYNVEVVMQPDSWKWLRSKA